MEISKAVDYFENLVNSAIASGAYKKMEQVLEARDAIHTIKDHLKILNNGKIENNKENKESDPAYEGRC
jgi:hypothetical protein